MRSGLSLLLPVVVAACSASPPFREPIVDTATAVGEETLTCSAKQQRASSVPPAVIVATAVDPDVIAERLPDIVTHSGPTTSTQGVIRLSSPVFASQFGFGVPGPIVFVTAAKLAPSPATMQLAATQDTYLREGAPNQNQGALTTLRLQESGRNRALVRVEQEGVSSFSGVAAATLALSIAANGDNWGTGRAISIHRLTQAWDEAGATWSCPSDSNLTNAQPDCVTAGWAMGNGAHPWVETPTAITTITNGQTGTVTFDVTADVAFHRSHPELNFGWIVKKVNEALPGRIELGSREAGSPAILDVTSTAPDPGDPWGPSYTARVEARCTAGASTPCPVVTFSATVTGGRFVFPLQRGLGNWRSSVATSGPGLTIDSGVITCTGSTPVLPIAP